MNQQTEDQAELLRRQMDEINQNELLSDEEIPEVNDLTDDIDVLNLPPRSAVHDEKQAKIHWKISVAFIRFFTVLFIIVVLLILTYSYWGDYFILNHQSHSLQANQVGQSVHVVSVTDSLSEELTKQIELTSKGGEKITVKGRYYITRTGDSLVSIVERYYDTDNVLPLIQEINGLTDAKDTPMDEPLRLFLPSQVR